mmetsp:Transcript_54242/g.172160  ORF Transcript_54242/g.172160 Transcript_54242/m.172160 type:complete len:209 (-) Transcript_54242:509-1135(-)
MRTHLGIEHDMEGGLHGREDAHELWEVEPVRPPRHEGSLRATEVKQERLPRRQVPSLGRGELHPPPPRREAPQQLHVLATQQLHRRARERVQHQHRVEPGRHRPQRFLPRVLHRVHEVPRDIGQRPEALDELQVGRHGVEQRHVGSVLSEHQGLEIRQARADHQDVPARHRLGVHQVRPAGRVGDLVLIPVEHGPKVPIVELEELVRP